MLKTISNKQLYDLSQAIVTIYSCQMNSKMRYAIDKNLKKLLEPIRAVYRISTPNMRYLELDKKLENERIKLLKSFCDKNNNGDLIYIDKNGQETTKPSNDVDFKLTAENIEKVSIELKKALDKLDPGNHLTKDEAKRQEKFKEYLKKNITIDIHYVHINDIESIEYSNLAQIKEILGLLAMEG